MLIEDDEKSIWYILSINNNIESDLNGSSSMQAASIQQQQKYKISACIIYVILCLIELASLFVIGLLAYIFKSNKSLIRNSVNVFILNIVFVDLLRCLVAIPIYLVSVHLTLDELTSPLPPSPLTTTTTSASYTRLIVLCNLNMTLMLLFEIVQLFSFLAISYERFKIVHSPFLNSKKRFFLARLLLAFTWFISILLSALIIFSISYISDYKNFSTQTKSCYLDVYSLVIDVYYNPSSQELVYDQVELDLRNRQTNYMDYFNMAISVISIGLSGYFYARIILFLKFHEKNIFSTITTGATATAAQQQQQQQSTSSKVAITKNQVEPVDTMVTSVVDTVVARRSRFAIVDENGDVVAAAVCESSSALPLPVLIQTGGISKNVDDKNLNSKTAVISIKKTNDFVRIDKMMPLVTDENDNQENINNGIEEDKGVAVSASQQRESASSGSGGVIEIHDVEGTVKTIKMKKVQQATTTTVAVDGAINGALARLNKADVRVEGDVCIVAAPHSQSANKNREKGKRRLEVRTAKKTFIIMLSFLSCQLMALCGVVVRKLPLFTQTGLLVDSFDSTFFVLSQLGIYFTVCSYVSCFLNSFTFILVTEFFKIEAVRLLKRIKLFLVKWRSTAASDKNLPK